MAIIVPRPDPVDRRDSIVTEPTSVYLYYDARDSLLYVGITSRAMRRQDEHNVKEWWPFVVRQEVVHCDSRAEALALERDLIQDLQPPFNKQHNRNHAVLRDTYLAFVSVHNFPRKPSKLLSVYGRRIPLVVHRQSEYEIVMRSIPTHAPLALAAPMVGGIDVGAGASKPWGKLVSVRRSGITAYFTMRGGKLHWPIRVGFVDLGFDGQVKDEKLKIRRVHLERSMNNAKSFAPQLLKYAEPGTHQLVDTDECPPWPGD